MKASTILCAAFAALALAACQQQPGCQVVRLHSSTTGDSAAVIVDSGHASIVPLGLAKPPAGHMYVLWQLPKDSGTMVPVSAFQQATHQTASSQLTRPYSDTSAFAISLEPAGAIPTRPGEILALGTVV